MSQLFQDSLVPWEKTAGCDANTSNAKSVESAPEPMSSVGRIASLLIFPFQGDFSPFYGFWGRNSSPWVCTTPEELLPGRVARRA